MSRIFQTTPAGICEAARAGDVSKIESILAKSPDLLLIDNPHSWTKTVNGHEIRGSYSKKPVEVAAFFNQPKAVAKLLEISRDSRAIKGPFSDFLPFDGHFNSLSVAIAMEHEAVVRVIISEVMTRLYVHPELLNEADDNGRTTIHYAAEQGCLSLVRELVKRGANVDSVQKSGRRVIHAVLDGPKDSDRDSVARLLIENGAEIDLWVATVLDDVEQVKLLLSKDRSLANKHFRPDRKNDSNGFPLVRACANGNQEIVEILLDHGADINADLGSPDRPEFGMPIIASVYAKHYGITKLLLDRGASIDAHPNCAAPLVDMLYYATDNASGGWLALGGMQHATDDPRSHLQPNDGGSSASKTLYDRIVSLDGKPQIYSMVKMNDVARIEGLLEQPTASPQEPGGPDTVFDCLMHAAAWLGNVEIMQLCLATHPDLHSPESANDHISAAIRSHNRDGSMLDYRRIIEMNLDFLADRQAELTIDPLWLLADDFLEVYSYGTHPELPSVDDLLGLAELFLNFVQDRQILDRLGSSVDGLSESSCLPLVIRILGIH